MLLPFFFFFPLLVVFQIHLFLELKKIKKKRARAAACSGACSASRGSRLQLFLSRPEPARASNFGPAGAHVCLPLASTLMCAPRPLAAACSLGAALARRRPERSPFPGPGPSCGRGTQAPRQHPGRGRSALLCPGAGRQGAPAPGTLRARLANVAGGHPRETDRKRARGDARTRDHSTETARAELQADPGMEGAGEEA